MRTTIGPCCPRGLLEQDCQYDGQQGTQMQFSYLKKRRIRVAFASMLLEDIPMLQAHDDFTLSRYLGAPAGSTAQQQVHSLRAAQPAALAARSLQGWGDESGDISESASDDDGGMGMGGSSGDGSEGSGSDEEVGRGKASDELEESTEEELSRINCGLCRKGLVGKRRPGSRQGADPTRVKICDACHKAFHAACCRRRGVGIKTRSPYNNSAWFCSTACESSYRVLAERCQAGPEQLPKSAVQPHDLGLQADDPTSGRSGTQGTGPATWLLTSSVGRRRDVGQRQAMEEVVSLLTEHYGPFVLRQVEGSDYGALLLRGDVPVAAATMDCFGPDACALDMLATRQEVRGCGNARALVTSLESFLGESGAAQQLIAIVDLEQGGGAGLLANRSDAGWRERARARGLPGVTDEEEDGADGALRNGGRSLWVRRLGFKAMTKRQVRQLRSRFPVLSFYSSSTIFYMKQLQGKPQAAGVARRVWGAGVAGRLGVRNNRGAAGKGADAGEGVIVEGQQRPAQQQREQWRPRKSYWRLRLWGWAARKALSAATFGLL